MQAELPAAIETWIAALQKCRQGQGLRHANLLHSLMLQQHLDSHPVLANYLIPTLVECGTLKDAQHVFDRLPRHHLNHHSWNSLISGYTLSADQRHYAFYLYYQMQHCVPPDRVTYLTLLGSCVKLNDEQRGHTLHADMIQRGLDADHFTDSSMLGNTLVDMYGKCNLLAEACHVFAGLPVRDTVSWNALIAAHNGGLGEHSHNFLELMILEGVSPDSATFVCSLRACNTIGKLEKGHTIHTEATKRGLERELVVGSALVAMYGECYSLVEARLMFDRLLVRDTIAWNTLIAAYAGHGMGEEAGNFINQMQFEGMSPNNVTFICSLKACATSLDLETGHKVHTEATKKGVEREPQLGSTLVDMYTDCGCLAEGRQVFDRLPSRDAAAWNTLIGGYLEQGLFVELENCFQQMHSEGMALDSVTFTFGLTACATVQAVEIGLELHVESIKRGLEIEVHVGSTLVDMYARCGSFAEAREVFNSLPVQNSVSCNSLIAGYADHGFVEEAWDAFQQMQKGGIPPNAVTLISCLKACGAAEALETGRAVHIETTKRGLERELKVGSSVVDMYTECGSLLEACEAFERLPVRNAISWNALIAGYAEGGPGEEAQNYLQELVSECAFHDAITFVCSLKLCGSVRALQVGRAIHGEVVKRGLARESCVGNMLVAMYIDCGSLAEAHQVLNGLLVQDAVSWAELFTKYAERGLGEEAISCFQRMQLESVCGGPSMFICSLRGCGITGALQIGQVLHAEITRRGMDGDLYMGSTLVDMYGKCGLISEARSVFDLLPVRSVVSWTALIKAYGKNHKGDMAIQSFEEMKEQGLKPTSVTFVSLLAACSHSSLVQKGQAFFIVMSEKYRIEPTSDHYACMADLLARSGHVQEAERFALAMQRSPSSMTLNTMLSACKCHGELEVAHRCFQQLLEVNKEDSSTSSLMAEIYASSTGRWSDAMKLDKVRNTREQTKTQLHCLR